MIEVVHEGFIDLLPLMRTHVIADTVKQKQATHLECVDGTTKGASWETLSRYVHPKGCLALKLAFEQASVSVLIMHRRRQ